ncbi:hypothetical protein BDV25DRAFT_137235 [Aspergillus avenaceus]|uniref:Uncharacterized protein n=1 Tax=Aspergillus avenaceus TaxID=36643 RepID=A0A5N6U4K8_ASPAV|nr:hypothetical protein BDV25DRAFT_137235 [Aspergillus avenaceus]
MAASFGEKLLAEVHEEGFHELLHDLHCLYASNVARERLGIGALDDLLHVFMPASQWVQPQEVSIPDQEHEQVLENQLPGVGHGEPIPRLKNVDPVVEISSTSSGAGKTQMLYYLTATAILPTVFHGVNLGKESAVVYIDADGRFDAHRLLAVARSIVQKKTRSRPGYTKDLGALLTTSLQHVHVFRPQSSQALLATLQSLDTYLLDTSRHLSATRPLHSILIDSASAFFWQDKLHDEVARTEDIGRPYEELERERKQRESFHLPDMYADLVAELKRLQRRLNCAVIYTTVAWSGRSVPPQPSNTPSGPFPLFNPNAPASKTPSFRSSLPGPWGPFPSLRLVVQRDKVNPFPPAMTASEARRQAPMRQEAVLKGRFVGWVNGWEQENWPQRVIEKLEESNGGMFSFYITANDVDFPHHHIP